MSKIPAHTRPEPVTITSWPWQTSPSLGSSGQDFKGEAREAYTCLLTKHGQAQPQNPMQQEPGQWAPHTSDSRLEIRLQVQDLGKLCVPQASLLTSASTPLSL